MQWSENDIPDLAGKLAIVSGGNSGLGFETVLALARHGAEVILAARDPARAGGAAKRIRALSPGAKLSVALLDLASLESVRSFAEEHTKMHGRLDILVNNAGVMVPPRSLTRDGFELQIGVNHLGHFALTGRLLPLLSASSSARVVNVSSFAAHSGRIAFDDLQSERSYKRYRAYGQSKLANLLFTRELGRRARARGLSLLCVAAHPGLAATELQKTTVRNTGARFEAWLYGWLIPRMGQSPAMGALPQLFGATSPLAKSGAFYGPSGIGIRGWPVEVKFPRLALDDAAAGRLWEVSEQLTSVSWLD